MRGAWLFKTVSVLIFISLTGSCINSDIHKGTVALGLGDYISAIGFFRRAIEKNPASFEAHLGMGKALLQQAIDNGNDTSVWKKAMMHLEAARTLNGSPEVVRIISQLWTERASNLLHTGDTITAIEMLSKAISVDPEYAEPLNLAGIIYFRTGRPGKARILFERAIKADTGNPALLFNLGMLFWEEKRVKEAYDLWFRALKKSPEDEDYLYWFALAEKKMRDSVNSGGEQGGKGR